MTPLLVIVASFMGAVNWQKMPRGAFQSFDVSEVVRLLWRLGKVEKMRMFGGAMETCRLGLRSRVYGDVGGCPAAPGDLRIPLSERDLNVFTRC